MLDLSDETRRQMVRAATEKGLSWHDAEDVAQSVYLECLRKKDPEIRNSKVYQVRAAKNRAVDLIRSQKRRKETPISDNLSAESDRENSAGHAADKVKLILPLLTPLRREVLEAVYLGGMTAASYAKSCGISLNTAAGRLREAKAALRKLVSL